jgi:hypothetical protein
MGFNVGDRVVWHTGFYGAEQGQRDPTWWPNDKHGVVIETKRGDYLIEFQDGTRDLASPSELESESGFAERQAKKKAARDAEPQDYDKGENVSSTG